MAADPEVIALRTALLRRSAQLLALVVLTGMAVAPATVAAQDDPPLDRLELPNGWAPEGITTLDGALYAGSLADGAIWQVDPATGEADVLVPGAAGVVAVGIDADSAGRLWVAGGATGQVRAYDAAAGQLLGEWGLDAGFLNDVAATDAAIYVTDSFQPQLIIIPLSADGTLDDAAAETVSISGDLEYGDGFNLNGIVAHAAGLIVVHSPTGDLYRLDPASGVTTRIETGDIALSAGDGLELDGSTLYVVRNRLNEVAVLGLDPDASAAKLVATLTSDDLDIPTTAALVGDDLWAVNARFGTDAGPDTEYWMTRLDASSDG